MRLPPQAEQRTARAAALGLRGVLLEAGKARLQLGTLLYGLGRSLDRTLGDHLANLLCCLFGRQILFLCHILALRWLGDANKRMLLSNFKRFYKCANGRYAVIDNNPSLLAQHDGHRTKHRRNHVLSTLSLLQLGYFAY